MPAQSVTAPPASRTSSPPAATSHGARPELEEAVEHAAGRPGEVQARRPGPPQVLEMLERPLHRRQVARKPFLVPEGEPGRHDRLLGRPGAHRAGHPAAAGALPARAQPGGRVPAVAQERRRDRAGDRTLVLHQRDRHPDRPEAVDEVRRAVQRIDHPAQALDVPAELLALERDLRRRLGQERLDRALARKIGLGDPVAGQSLGLAGARRVARAHHVGALERGGAREPTHPFEIHRGHATSRTVDPLGIDRESACGAGLA